MTPNLSINRIVTYLLGFGTIIALAPPNLQNQIPQLFPEKYRGIIALVLAFATFVAHSTTPSGKPILPPPLFQPPANPQGDGPGHTAGKS
jgi:hypothetical protein